MNMLLNTKCVLAGYTPGNGEPRQIHIIQSTTLKYDTSEEIGGLFDLQKRGNVLFYSSQPLQTSHQPVAPDTSSNSEGVSFTEVNEFPPAG